MTDLDVDRLRADTPGCASVVHLNNAGAALQPRQVHERVVAHLERELHVGGYEAAAEVADELAAVRDEVATLVGGAAHEVAIVHHATQGWQQAFWAFARHLRPGQRILTAVAEYASNVIPYLQARDHLGVEVVVVPDDEHGQLDVDALRELADERTGLIAVTHVPTQGGLVNPAAEIGAVAREVGVPYLLDACQSAGQLDLDVHEIGCTALSATSRKYLRGPRGVGFLWVHQDWIPRLEPPMVDLLAAEWPTPDTYRLADDARRFEDWERNVAAVLGFGRAVAYAREVGIPAIEARVTALAATLRARLAEVPGLTVRDQGQRRCGIVTFTVDGEDPTAVVTRLRTRGINTSASMAGSARHDLDRRGIDGVVRASVHAYNTEDELHTLVEALAR